ncbi:hypothetical protein [Kitasatospora sp. NBC_00315]|uniref:hypothetical protein n=1 Tax=Kitasatospora sp. NBC_00315 TaxID=2975963 RepID=UPI0032550D12
MSRTSVALLVLYLAFVLTPLTICAFVLPRPQRSSYHGLLWCASLLGRILLVGGLVLGGWGILHAGQQCPRHPDTNFCNDDGEGPWSP